MGVMNDKLISDYFGNQLEVEGTAGFASGTFQLIINNVKVDEAKSVWVRR